MYVKVKVTTDSRHESLRLIGDNRLQVAVREPAERNLANSRVRALVAEFYGVPPQAVSLISGHHSSSKMLVIRGK